jgi:hypothetical protein
MVADITALVMEAIIVAASENLIKVAIIETQEVITGMAYTKEVDVRNIRSSAFHLKPFIVLSSITPK